MSNREKSIIAVSISDAIFADYMYISYSDWVWVASCPNIRWNSLETCTRFYSQCRWGNINFHIKANDLKKYYTKNVLEFWAFIILLLIEIILEILN